MSNYDPKNQNAKQESQEDAEECNCPEIFMTDGNGRCDAQPVGVIAPYNPPEE